MAMLTETMRSEMGEIEAEARNIRSRLRAMGEALPAGSSWRTVLFDRAGIAGGLANALKVDRTTP